MAEFYISSTKYSIKERQTKKNGRVYDVIFRVITMDGAEMQKRLCGYKTKTLAREAHTEFVTTKCELVKQNPFKKKDPQKADLTVGELFREYISSLSNQNRQSTIGDKIHVFEKFIFPRFEDTPVNQLTKEKLYQWQDALWSAKIPGTSKHYAYDTLKLVRSRFSAFLTWCEDRYNYENNLKCVKIPKRKNPKSKIEYWEEDEFKRFIAVVDDRRYCMIFTFLFYTGLRKGEMSAINPDDLKNHEVSVTKSISFKALNGAPYRIEPPKNGEDRIVPMCKPLQKELDFYQGESPFFFGGEKPISPSTLKNALNRYCKKAGVKIIHPHCFRHSFASLLIHKGASVFVVADLLGDTVEQVMQTYGHMYPSDKQKIIESID